jgi:restriction endonuclease S subunit
MTKIEQTAIKSAEERLEQERKEKLQEEIYSYLKGELEAIDSLDQQISKLKTEKVAHEENIKNIKQGNLEAIEKRRQSFPYTFTTTSSVGDWITLSPSSNGWYNSGTQFYTSSVAGITVTTSNGRTTIF